MSMAKLAGIAAVTAAGLLLSGCSSATLQLQTVAESVSDSAAVIAIAAGKPNADGRVSPDQPIVVTVQSGRLTDVSVTGPKGPLRGRMSQDGRTWTSRGGGLGFEEKYEVVAQAVDRLGLPAKSTTSVTTLRPLKFVKLESVTPSGEDVGIGFPMKVNLSRGVSKKFRDQLEARMVVKANDKVIQGGAWRWDTASNLQYRPPKFWPGNSTITLDAQLKGIDFGRGTYGRTNETRQWSTADAMISYVNLATHQMRVTSNGKTLRTIPITGGKAGFESRNGIKVILTKETSRRMDAATGGTSASDPEYYNLVVQYAMRVTWSGEFVHAAPWSVGSQGRANVSHGCTGMSTDNAAWLFGIAHIGDLVIYTGGRGTMGPGNGVFDWNVPLERWAEGYDS